MNFLRGSILILACVAGVGPVAAAETFAEAMKESKFLVNWRLRHEAVDQTGFTDWADVVTSRIRAGVQTGNWGKTNLLAEFVYSESIGDDFNSTLNGNTQFPVVADPGGIAAVNRFAVTNNSINNSTLTFGRQRIVLDDSRFVGNVGWRQNEQTYDGIRAVIGGGDAVKVDLSYISQVNRIFGPDSPVGKFNGDIILANVSKKFGVGTLTGFLYGVELDQAAALSTNTVGMRLNGSKAFDSITGLYTVSFARQTDTGNNTADFSASYVKLEGGLKFSKLTIALGLEQLGSDGTHRVTMPLATLHAFQGWADKFLGTPINGVDDTYARFALPFCSIGPFSAITLAGFYHEFDANQGAVRYGDEIDISLNARSQRASFTLKYASYDADSLFTDTDKLWLSMDYSF